MARLTKLDHEAKSVSMATMECMAASVSNEDSVASKGEIVLLIRTVNGGSALRYDSLDLLGADVISALKSDDAAFKVIKEAELNGLIDGLSSSIEDDGLLDVEIHAFQFGSYYAYYETTS